MAYEVILIIRYIDWANQNVKFAVTEQLTFPSLKLEIINDQYTSYEDNSCSCVVLDKLLEKYTGYSTKYIPIKLLNFRDDYDWLDYDGKRLGSLIYGCNIPEIQPGNFAVKWIDALKLHEVLKGNNSKLVQEINLCSTF